MFAYYLSNHSELFRIYIVNLFHLEKMPHISTQVYTYVYILYKIHCIQAYIIAQNNLKQLFYN